MIHGGRLKMSIETLPAISSLPSLPALNYSAVLDSLFEPCSSLHTLCLDRLQNHTFSSYEEMIAEVGSQLLQLASSDSASEREQLNSILSAHPRLGEKKIQSQQSRMEQAHLQSHEEAGQNKLAEMNLVYEKTFPRLKYMYVLFLQSRINCHDSLTPLCRVFVNGRDRNAIIDDMQFRINRKNIQLERTEAIKVRSCAKGLRWRLPTKMQI